MDRVIGEYTGPEHGPLLIAFGGMHGNELAGVKALDLVLKMLEVEPIRNPSFAFKGKLLGLRGNLQALQNKERYIKKDLNRLWTAENLTRVLSTNNEELYYEELELKELFLCIRQAIDSYSPKQIFLLDLHTTTASGGIFSIPTNDLDSRNLALALHAPVIEGFLEGIKGTTLHFFNSNLLQIPTCALSFESGQHDEPLSINRAVAAVINWLRSIGAVQPDDVENQHDNILKEYSKGLPKLARLVQVHQIKKGDNFEMKPGYKNFQAVQKGEVVANDKSGPIAVAQDGHLLMPLYQKQGDDGFFVVKNTPQ